MTYEHYLRKIGIEDFYLKDGDKILKDLGSGCFDVFLIEKSLFSYFFETKNLIYILYPYLFIITFNTYMTPIFQNPSNYDPNEGIDNFVNPFLDIPFIYANSFLYVQIWLINYSRKKEIDKINQIRNNILNELENMKEDILNKLAVEKQNDVDNTYCQQCCCSCEEGSCCCDCTLIHYIQAWDNLRNYIINRIDQYKQYINDQFDDLIDYTNRNYDILVQYTTQLFNIRLYWTFILIIFFVKFPYVALKPNDEIINQKKERVKKIDLALLLIDKYNGHSKDYIKNRIKSILKVSENAVNLYLYKLKQRGFIKERNDKKRKKIYITKVGLKRVDYLKEKYKGELNGIGI